MKLNVIIDKENPTLFARLNPRIVRRLSYELRQKQQQKQDEVVSSSSSSLFESSSSWYYSKENDDDDDDDDDDLIDFLPLKLKIPTNIKNNDNKNETNGNEAYRYIYVSYNGGKIDDDTVISLPSSLFPLHSPPITTPLIITQPIPPIHLPTAQTLTIQPHSLSDWESIESNASYFENGGLLSQLSLVYRRQTFLLRLGDRKSGGGGGGAIVTVVSWTTEGDDAECVMLRRDTRILIIPISRPRQSYGYTKLIVMPIATDVTKTMKKEREFLKEKWSLTRLPCCPQWGCVGVHPETLRDDVDGWMEVKGGGVEGEGYLGMIRQVVRRREDGGEERRVVVVVLEDDCVTPGYIALRPSLRYELSITPVYSTIELQMLTRRQILNQQINSTTSTSLNLRYTMLRGVSTRLSSFPTGYIPSEDIAQSLSSLQLSDDEDEEEGHKERTNNDNPQRRRRRSYSTMSQQPPNKTVMIDHVKEWWTTNIIQPITSSSSSRYVPVTSGAILRLPLTSPTYFVTLTFETPHNNNNNDDEPPAFLMLPPCHPSTLPITTSPLPPLIHHIKNPLLHHLFHLYPRHPTLPLLLQPLLTNNQQHTHVILHGPSGSGKTHLTLLYATYLKFIHNYPLYYLDCRALKMTHGSLTSLLPSIIQFFKGIDEKRACCVLLDDLDELTPHVSSSGPTSSSSVATTSNVSALLSSQSKLLTDVILHSLTELSPESLIITCREESSLQERLRRYMRSRGGIVMEVPSLSMRRGDGRFDLLKRLVMGDNEDEEEEEDVVFVPDEEEDEVIRRRLDGHRPADIVSLAKRYRHYRHLVSLGRRCDDNHTAKTKINDLRQWLLSTSSSSENNNTPPSKIPPYHQFRGWHHAKRILKDVIIDPLRYDLLYSASPVKLSRNVLFYGPPGCGKSTIPPSLAKSLHLPIRTIHGPSLLSRYIGKSEHNLRQLFYDVQSSQNSDTILFFDDIDALCPKRGSDATGGVTDRVVNQLLTFLDGVEESGGGNGRLWVWGATSRPEVVDMALLRPGRLERWVYVGMPTIEERGEIMRSFKKRDNDCGGGDDDRDDEGIQQQQKQQRNEECDDFGFTVKDVSDDELEIMGRCLGDGYTPADIREIWERACLNSIERRHYQQTDNNNNDDAFVVMTPIKKDEIHSSDDDNNSIIIEKQDLEVGLKHVTPSLNMNEQRRWDHLSQHVFSSSSGTTTTTTTTSENDNHHKEDETPAHITVGGNVDESSGESSSSSTWDKLNCDTPWGGDDNGVVGNSGGGDLTMTSRKKTKERVLKTTLL